MLLERNIRQATKHFVSAIFYLASVVPVVVGIVSALTFVEYGGNLITGDPMYEVPKAVVIWVVASYAILVNALVLLQERRRNLADRGDEP